MNYLYTLLSSVNDDIFDILPANSLERLFVNRQGYCCIFSLL